MKNSQITIRRIFATVVDFVIVLALMLVSFKVLGYDFNQVLAVPLTSNLIGLGTLAILELITLSIWSKTPGQALLGLKVINADSSMLSFFQSLTRAVLVLIIGSAIGLPYFGLIYIAWAINTLKLVITGSTFWDDLTNSSVVKN